MKKAIVSVIIFTMIWALLCGCTPKPESEQTSGNMSLPELQTEKNFASDPADTGSQDKQPEENNTNPQSSDTADQTAESVSESVDEMETETDYVVGGGDGSGFGGN